MSMAKSKKAELIQNFANKENDCGSPEVQVALLSEHIKNLTEHFKIHKKDKNSQRGLLTMVSRRRKLLDYLARRENGRYRDLIQKLGLRR